MNPNIEPRNHPRLPILRRRKFKNAILFLSGFLAKKDMSTASRRFLMAMLTFLMGEMDELS